MQTIHLKAENNVIEDILKHVNKLNQSGKRVELLDDRVLKEEEKGKQSSYDDIWRAYFKNK